MGDLVILNPSLTLDQTSLSVILDILLVAAGFLAGFAAYRKDFLNWLRRPKMEMQYKPDYPFITLFDKYLNKGKPIKQLYFHVKINNKGRMSARQCSMELTEIWTKHHDGFRKRKHYVPSMLKWALIDDDFITFIHRNQHKYIDIGHIAAGRWGDLGFDIDSALRLGFYRDLPKGLVKELAPKGYGDTGTGVHRIVLTLFGENFSPIEECFEISWSGNFPDDIRDDKENIKGINEQMIIKKSKRPNQSEISANNS